MNAAARQSVAEAFAEILARRHPEASWSARPIERADRVGLPAGAGEIVRPFAAPEDKGALGDRDVGTADAADEDRIESPV